MVPVKERNMRRIVRTAAFAAVLLSAVLLGGCSGNVGVGLSVGIPIGDHGYVSVGSGRW
jgi:hypothetical protein